MLYQLADTDKSTLVSLGCTCSWYLLHIKSQTMNLKQNKYIGFTPYWSNTLTLSTINITFYDLVYVAQEKVYNWPKSYIFFSLEYYPYKAVGTFRDQHFYNWWSISIESPTMHIAEHMLNVVKSYSKLINNTDTLSSFITPVLRVWLIHRNFKSNF